jgi:hypothetical protein
MTVGAIQDFQGPGGLLFLKNLGGVADDYLSHIAWGQGLLLDPGLPEREKCVEKSFLPDLGG